MKQLRTIVSARCIPCASCAPCASRTRDCTPYDRRSVGASRRRRCRSALRLLLLTLLCSALLGPALPVSAEYRAPDLRKLGLDATAVAVPQYLESGENESRAAEAVLGQRVADRAYSYAGQAQGYFDCSLFVQTVLEQEGIAGCRSAPDYAVWGRAVDVDLWDIDLAVLLPGDVIGYDTLQWGATCHVGIYLGDGQAIHVNTVDCYMEVCDLRLRADFPITFVRRAQP